MKLFAASRTGRNATALSATNDARINEGQYEAFFIQFAQNVLTDRCRQFLYSCITPAMNVDK